MYLSPVTLLLDRERFWDEAARESLQWREVSLLVLFIITSCGLYGMVLAGWRSWELAFYVAIKLPAVFLVTTGIVFCWNFAAHKLWTFGEKAT